VSDSEQDDTKRRQRARFVEALTTTSRQPGESSRAGIRIAGAVAVLALIAGGTLGIGAWRGHQADENAKKEKIATQQAVAERKFTEAPSASPTAKPKKTTKPTPTPPAQAPRSEVVVPPVTHSPPPSKRPSKKPVVPVVRERSKVLLKNVATGLCADIPDYGPGQFATPVNQYYCDGSAIDNQLWNMQVHLGDTGPGGRTLVIFSNAKDGLCLDLTDRGAKPAGTPIQEANCHNSLDDNQLWWLEPSGGDVVKIHNMLSNGLCLQVQGAAVKTRDQRLVIGPCGEADARWRLLG
jgi:hypothetical protein